MKAGNVYRVFKAKDGRKVILRALRWDDLDDAMEFANSLVEEGAEIMLDQKQTREQEVDWLARALSELEKGEKIYVAAEVDGKLVGNSHVSKPSARRQSHLGVLGIAIRDGYRDIGIGTEMMRILIDQSRKMGLKILILDMFADNGRARHVYEKVGFREVGRIPKGLFNDGEYIDEIRMALEL
nr:GNAT family protein [Candidatus Njordarchaeota archaeon]